MFSTVQVNPQLNDLNETFLRTDSALSDGPKVSIYVPPVSADVPYGNRKFLLIRLIKNAEALIRRDYGSELSSEVISLLWRKDPLAELDKSHQTMVIYHDKSATKILSIPIETPALSVVSRSFHIKPLLTWLQCSQNYYLINLSKRKIYLYQGNAYELKCLKVFEDTTSISVAKKKSYKLDTLRLRKFYTSVEKKLYKNLSQNRYPVILAGVSYLQSIFRQVNRDPDLILQSIDGNVERKSEADLRTASHQIMVKLFEQFKKEMINEFQESEWTGKATDNLIHIADAAAKGKIKKLLVASDKLIWGIYNSRSGSITIHPEQLNSFDEDILDDLAETVLNKGGKVICMKSNELPTANPVAALL